MANTGNGFANLVPSTLGRMPNAAGTLLRKMLAVAIDGYSVSYAAATLTAGRNVPPEMAKAAPYRRMRFGVA